MDEFFRKFDTQLCLAYGITRNGNMIYGWGILGHTGKIYAVVGK
jgi:hypothetical protein